MKAIKALEAEKEYFDTHPVYSKLPPGSCGTASLSTKLTTILFKHIRAFLPTIVKEI